MKERHRQSKLAGWRLILQEDTSLLHSELGIVFCVFRTSLGPFPSGANRPAKETWLYGSTEETNLLGTTQPHSRPCLQTIPVGSPSEKRARSNIRQPWNVPMCLPRCVCCDVLVAMYLWRSACSDVLVRLCDMQCVGTFVRYAIYAKCDMR